MSNVIHLKEITEIINERKFIDNILAEGYMDSVNTVRILGKLAKHFYWDLGYKEARTVKALHAYMENYDPQYHLWPCPVATRKHTKSEEWISLFKRLYNLAIKTPICDRDGIWITQAELDKIAELHDKVKERLAFVMLCYAKLYRLRNPLATGWLHSNKYRDMFHQARITCKQRERFAIFAALEKAGYLYSYQMPSAEDQDCMSEYKLQMHQRRLLDFRVTFINDTSENVIFVDDWRELGYYYRRYKGENIIQCGKCGRLTRGNKNGTRKYCKICTDEVSTYKIDCKFFKCIDCGTLVPISLNQRARKRCDDCAAAERKAHNRAMYLKRKNQNSTN